MYSPMYVQKNVHVHVHVHVYTHPVRLTHQHGVLRTNQVAAKVAEKNYTEKKLAR